MSRNSSVYESTGRRNLLKGRITSAESGLLAAKVGVGTGFGR